jgi:hypothetical protein
MERGGLIGWGCVARVCVMGCALASFAHDGFAQSRAAMGLARQPHAQAEAASAGPVQPAATPAEWIDRMTAAYRSGPIVEHIEFEGVIPAGQRADAWLRVDAGSDDDASPRVARLRLDASRAIIWAQGDRVVFAHADNPVAFAERVVAGGFAGGLIREVPQSPLPQLGLALTDTSGAPRWDPRRVRWNSASTQNDVVTLEGMLDQQRVALNLDAATARLVSFELTVAQDQTLKATVTRLAAEDPQTWPIALTGRTKVASPAELRALPRPIEPGQAAPPLGLMTRDLSGWSLVENLAQAAKAGRGQSGAIGALVLVGGSSDPAQVGLSLRAARGAARLARELDAQLAQGLPQTPKLLVRMVGVLELAEVSRERIAALEAQWRAANPIKGEAGRDAMPELLWTSGGIETLRQLAPAQSVALVLIDDRQVLRGVLTLEGRLLDEAAIAEELRTMLREPVATPGEKPALNKAGEK